MVTFPYDREEREAVAGLLYKMAEKHPDQPQTWAEALTEERDDSGRIVGWRSAIIAVYRDKADAVLALLSEQGWTTAGIERREDETIIATLRDMAEDALAERDSLRTRLQAAEAEVLVWTENAADYARRLATLLEGLQPCGFWSRDHGVHHAHTEQMVSDHAPCVPLYRVVGDGAAAIIKEGKQ